MSWCVEEYCEDAVKAYLESKIDDEAINVYVAWTNDVIAYPCAIVHAGKSSNVEGTSFNGARAVEVAIAVMTAAADSATKDARALNREARDTILTALAMTALHDDINALEPDGVVFSLAYIGDITRSVESDKRVFVSEVQLVCIASPKDVK